MSGEAIHPGGGGGAGGVRGFTALHRRRGRRNSDRKPVRPPRELTG